MRAAHLFLSSLFISLLAVSIPVHTLQPESASSPRTSNLAHRQAAKKNKIHYVSECQRFVSQKLYEAALFSCYNAYQLGSSNMGGVLYQLGKNHFFDEVTANNLMQEYKGYKSIPAIQRLLMNIKFTSESDAVAQGSIYGSWCFDKAMNPAAASSDNEGASFEGYARLVINPNGRYIQATAQIQRGKFTYRNNILSLGYPSFSDYQVTIINKNQLMLKAKELKNQSAEKPQEKEKIYSRKACSKLGMQRFLQALVNNKSTTDCDDISNYLGRQLIPTQYLPNAILNTLKQDPKRYNCPQLLKKISEA